MKDFTPKRFISIHNHTHYSVSDAMGSPFDHMDAVRENGMDTFISTDHGTMAAFAPAYLYMKELRAKGVNFKYSCGCEMYLHPDLSEWAILREKIKKESINKKKEKKSKTDMSEVEMNGLVIEDEGSSKGRLSNPLNRRHHLVVLPRNSKGLKNLFTLVSRSFREGYYRFPRIDYKMLKEFGEGLLVSTACCAGTISYEIFDMFPEVEWSNLSPELLDDPAKMNEAMRKVGNIIDRLSDAVGEENVFAEIQFNKLGAQHLTNRAVLEFSRRNNFKIVATCDSHYPRRDLWKSREIYKALGWLNYKDIDPDKIPKSRDDLKCELYPKNVEQMWETYKTDCTHSFYDDEMVSTAIENGWYIAHEMIDDIKFDESPKLPQWIVPKGKDSIHALVELCKEGLQKKNLIDNIEYVNRMKKEVKVIHEKGFENYFLLMHAFMKVAQKTQIIGPGRGCFIEGTRVKMADGLYCPIEMISKGDRVIDAYGESRLVTHKYSYDVNEELVELTVENGKKIVSTVNHEFLTSEYNGSWCEAQDIVPLCTDLLDISGVHVKVIKKRFFEFETTCKVYDLQVEKSHTYNVEGLAVHNSSAGSLVNYLLEITQIDPIKHGLIFERFISKARCLDENLFVKVSDGSNKRLRDLTVGESIWTGTDYSRVTDIIINDSENQLIEFVINGKTYRSSLTHRWPVLNNNCVELLYSQDLRVGDSVCGLMFAPNTIESVKLVNDSRRLIDITIDHPLHMFAISSDCHKWLMTHNSDMPDIDSDFSDRDSLVEDLRIAFGYDNVLYISNWNALQLKSLVKDVSRFFSVPFDEVNNMTKVVERQVKAATQKQGDDKNLFQLKFDDAMEHSKDFKEFMEKYPEIAEIVPKLVGQPKSCGRHAGGLLLLENAEQIMPVIKVRDNLQSPWQEGLTLKTLERLGFLKIDALGLDTLRIIQRCIEKIIQGSYGSLLRLNIDGEDIDVYENQWIKLESGEFKKAKDISFNDEIQVPIETKNPSE